MRFSLIFSVLCLLYACNNTPSTPQITEETQTQDTTTSKQVEEVIEPIEPPTLKEGPVFVWLDDLRIRTEPTTKSDIVVTVQSGTELKYLGEKSDFNQKMTLRGQAFDEPWLRVKAPKGQIGWVYGGAIKFKDDKSFRVATSPYASCRIKAMTNLSSAADCTKKIQAKQLKARSKYVKSTKEGLTLTLLSGKTTTLKNNLGEGEEYEEYIYHQYLSRMGFYVVQSVGMEHKHFVLVNDKTGKQYIVQGDIEPAPNGKRLISFGHDLNEHMFYNGFQVWEYTATGFKMVFEKELDEYEPHNPIWIDDNTIELSLKTHPMRDKQEIVEGRIAFEKGKWSYAL